MYEQWLKRTECGAFNENFYFSYPQKQHNTLIKNINF